MRPRVTSPHEPPPRDLPARVHTDVTVRNATGSKLRGARLVARRHNGHKLTVKLKAIPKGKKRVVHVKGTAHGWDVGAGATRCTVHKHRKVTCVVRDYPTGALPLPDSFFHPVPDPARRRPAPKTAGIFAPYVDEAGWPVPDLAQISADSGASHLSLGFVVQAQAGGCTPAWGAKDALPGGRRRAVPQGQHRGVPDRPAARRSRRSAARAAPSSSTPASRWMTWPTRTRA